MSIKFIKKIEKNQSTYHCIQLDVSTYSLFDDIFDNPVCHGSKNLVQMKINQILKQTSELEISIIYYKRGISEKDCEPIVKKEIKKFSLSKDPAGKVIKISEQ